jgi:glutamine synthetase
MISEPIVRVCTCEIAGRVRGKGFPVAYLSARLKSSVGRAPTNTMISALGSIADTPLGVIGDLKDLAGLELQGAFEQEFVYTGVEDHPGSPASLASFRRQAGEGKSWIR